METLGRGMLCFQPSYKQKLTMKDYHQMTHTCAGEPTISDDSMPELHGSAFWNASSISIDCTFVRFVAVISPSILGLFNGTASVDAFLLAIKAKIKRNRFMAKN